MFRVILAAVLGAVVVFLWGFVYWTKLPFGDWVLKPVPNDETVTKALQDNLPQTGVYLFPHWDQQADEATQQAAIEKHRQGPVGQIIFVKEGSDPMAPSVFVAGFIQMFLAAVVAATLLRFSAPASYRDRVIFVALLGLFAVAAVHLSDVVWFHHPWQYAALQGAYDLGGWVLAGLVLGALIRPVAAPVDHTAATVVRGDPARRPVGVPPRA